MITPRFHITQNDESVTIIIRAPYCSLRELDVSVEDNVFIFLCKPYYLRLNLPGNIIENDRTRCKFDSDTAELTFSYDKENSGEHFEDLDYITMLLCSKVEVEEGGRKIEILTTEGNAEEGINSETADTEEYGFAMRGGYHITNLDSEFCEVFQINPHKFKLCERGALRVKNEKEKFDADHYLADFLDNEEIKSLCSFNNPWKNIDRDKVSFSSTELDFLKDLPHIKYNLNSKQIQYCHNSLLEILFAYCYDRRTTCFESTCESGWTVSTISASLSWFDSFTNPKAAIICAHRRSLTFPLYRSFVICEQVFQDLKLLLQLGETFLIKCLIEMYYLFLQGDSGQFILNNLFIKDYIIYIMQWNKESWSSVVNETVEMKIQKSDLGLNLLQIEDSVDCGSDINSAMANLTLADHKTSEDSDDSSGSDDSCSFEDTSDSDEDSCMGSDDIIESPNNNEIQHIFEK